MASPPESGRPRFLQACLNGGRSKLQVPGVPMTSAELGRDDAAVSAAGACGVHVHFRSATGAESLAAEGVNPALEAIRAVAPDLEVAAGAWIAPGGGRARLRLVEAWRVLPDVASVEYRAARAILEAAGLRLPVLLHGEGGSVWPMVELALVEGHATRVGFADDGLHLPDGTPAPSNAAALVQAAVALRAGRAAV